MGHRGAPSPDDVIENQWVMSEVLAEVRRLDRTIFQQTMLKYYTFSKFKSRDARLNLVFGRRLSADLSQLDNWATSGLRIFRVVGDKQHWQITISGEGEDQLAHLVP